MAEVEEEGAALFRLRGGAQVELRLAQQTRRGRRRQFRGQGPSRLLTAAMVVARFQAALAQHHQPVAVGMGMGRAPGHGAKQHHGQELIAVGLAQERRHGRHDGRHGPLLGRVEGRPAGWRGSGAGGSLVGHGGTGRIRPVFGAYGRWLGGKGPGRKWMGWPRNRPALPLASADGGTPTQRRHLTPAADSTTPAETPPPSPDTPTPRAPPPPSPGQTPCRPG